MNVWSQYLEKLNNEQKDIVQRVMKIAMRLSPESTADMPYGVPGLKLKGRPLFAVAAHKAHYGIYPFSPEVIESARPLLKNLETAKGTIRFNYKDFPTEKLVKTLIDLRTKEIM